MNKGEIKLSIGEGIEIHLSSDQGVLDAAEGFEQHLFSAVDVVNEEPEHRESLLFVDREQLEDRDRGTAFDATEALYTGWEVDTDSEPTGYWRYDTPMPITHRHQLPTEPMCWGIEPRD